jgi:hypothetical protein
MVQLCRQVASNVVSLNHGKGKGDGAGFRSVETVKW